MEKAGWKTLLSGQNGLRSIALAGGVVLHATDVYLATTIMPSVTRDIGGLAFYSWATTIYVIAAIIGSVISSRNLAKQGPKVAYRTAILLFSAGTLICATAPHMSVLLVGRFFQGVGGGLLFALSYAMISIIFEEALWPRAMGLVSAMWGISAFTGPLIGGVFTQYSNWRMAFVTLMVIALLLMILTEKILPKSTSANGRSSKVPAGKLLIITAATLAVSVGGIMENIWANLAGIGVAMALFIVLALNERRTANRLLPHGAYRISTMLGATYLVIALLQVATVVEIYIPYFMQVIHGFQPLKAGYLAVLLSIGWSISSIGFSGLAARQVNKVIVTGAVMMLVSMAGLAFGIPEGYSSTGIPFLLMCLLLMSIGLGVGMGWSHLLTRILTSAPKGEEEKASASITTVQLLSTAFGAALAGLIANSSGIVDPGGLAGAQHAASWLFGLFAIAPALSLVILGKTHSSKR